ncbi:1-acyl-sn-glycerol-3-phosphate acyltransferase [Conexibacter sp. DBS9H8]|uniref:1-acyl-sn-glycerol-3-phosphate acyltransferase n=1 Tax=Conexibacter sp. DBS9H8 TaxID=2937801 RepID=UPI00200E1232|nr:1-acyl-sn-glycerol-3-phosphate acyltransferase [Conexibacter sp. DBS9H8]
MDDFDLEDRGHAALHARAREQGVNRLVYRIVRLVLVPFFAVYFRLDRVGRDHIPRTGAAIIASNHRSFLDPFVIGACARRPLYFVAKKELFRRRWQAWILNSLGAFPVDRGRGDEETIATAKAILARGEIVLIFPEGTRIRPGTLGKPKRGVGRLALETGVPVIPIAVTGTEAIRRGWRIRPHKVRVRAGRPLHFPTVAHASPQLAAAVTNRIWPCVALQWEWLGGLAPIRRACVIGAGRAGTALAIALAEAGYDVDLGCRTAEQAKRLADSRVNAERLAGAVLPDRVNVVAAQKVDLYGHDLICLAVPAAALPAVMDAHGDQIPRSAGVLVLSTGTVPPLGTRPSAYVGERCRARALAVVALEEPWPQTGAAATVAASEKGFARQMSDVLRDLGLSVSVERDVRTLEDRLAGETPSVQAA